MIRYASDPERQAEFSALQLRFLNSAAERVEEALGILSESGESCPEGEPGQRFRKIAHDIRGAGGSYGFQSVTDTAAKLEDAFLDDQAGSELKALTMVLKAAVARARHSLGAGDRAGDGA